MTIDLDALEALYISRKFTLGSVPDTVLGLVAELRKARASREHWQRVAVILADVLVDYQEPAGVPPHKRNSREQILKGAGYAAAREAVEEL